MHVIGFEIERIGIEGDAPDRDRPVELLRQLLLGDMADDGRRYEESEQADNEYRKQQPDENPPRAPRVHDAAQRLAGGSKRRLGDA